tara:strand:- start:1605 stop:2246 length:642 start_codon:yes stop_codon:yes gene_type:complete
MAIGESATWRNLSATAGATIGVVVLSALLTVQPARAQGGCETGAIPLATAYILGMPMYAMYMEENLQSYVTKNSAHFVSGGDAIRCAHVLSAALMNSSLASYDPDALRSRDEANARLGALGISPGTPVLSASAAFFMMGQQISRLAAVLPTAARGGPLQSHLTQEQVFAAQLLTSLLQDPIVRASFAQVEPLVRAAAEAELRLLLSIAAGATG